MSETNTSLSVSDLLSLLGEQRDLYEHLGRLAGMQRTLITSEDSERLLAVLRDRQELVDRLEVLAERIRPYLRSRTAFRAGLQEDDARKVDRLVGQVNGLLAGILEQDKSDTQLLAARKSSVANEIATVATGRQAGVAYAASTCADLSRAEVGTSVDWMDEG